MSVMSLEQVRDWLLDLHDNFNGCDPALDDFKFAADSIDAALAKPTAVAWQFRFQFSDARGAWNGWTQADSQASMESIVSRYRSLGCPAEGRSLYTNLPSEHGWGWDGWATQSVGRLPKLYGAREIAELNWYAPDDLIHVAEVDRINKPLPDPPTD